MTRGQVRRAALALAVGAFPSTSPAQVPASPEFVVNTYTFQEQRRPALAMDARGNFVVAWQSRFQDGADYGVFLQRFDQAGVRIGGEFQANTSTVSNQLDPSVAADRNGDFVVVWRDEFSVEVFGQRFASSGARRGAQFRVSTYTTGSQREPAVAMDLGGNFVVVWASQFRDGDEYGVFGRRFDASGAPLATEFQVNTTTTGPQRRPDVSLLPGGGFVVAWDGPLGGGNRVFGRLYDANGAPQGDEFTLGSAALAQSGVDLSSPGGGFVAAWTSYGQDGSHNAVMARRFNSLATPLGEEFLVNTYTTNSQAFPVVASGSFSGSFVVAWESFGQDGSMDGVFGQRFGATGARRGAEFRLNSYTTAAQRHVALASDRAGNLAAAWTSDGGQDGSNAVIGRRFQGLFPAGLAVTAEGNGVLEVNEDFGLATSWRNASGAAQTFQGAASEATSNPPFLVLTLGGTASYGTVADGAVGTCSGLCFSGGLTGTRGAGHTDLSFLETIEPDVQGQQKRWFLHVGDSFTDVPRTNPFYRFIETLLHHGVTTGCAANTYCPSGPTTREGMAVFVLAAKEGTLYTPPACTTPVFADVPASSPFCRWVEELARRGVVSGCATGRYCPGDAVTREQMAVFVLRTLDEDLDPPACTTPVFSDVPADSPFCRWIEELVRRGVVSGCAAGRYCPTQAVSREQMGVFISVTFGLNLYGP